MDVAGITLPIHWRLNLARFKVKFLQEDIRDVSSTEISNSERNIDIVRDLPLTVKVELLDLYINDKLFANGEAGGR